MRRTSALLLLALLTACREQSKEPSAGKSEAAASDPAAAVPVRVAAVLRAPLVEALTAPGKTAATAQQKIRPPFAGRLIDLKVSDGDTVRKGDVLATVVSRESEAAVNGAREMAREARSEAEKADAQRAVQLAEKALVQAAVRAPADGAVLSHAAANGDRVTEDQELLTIADASSIVFLADLAQSDLLRIKPGQSSTVTLAGRPRPVPGTVHAVLAGANAADFTAPVRIDFESGGASLPVGLFGTARIVVGEHRDATLVPQPAVLRDDVTGTARLATVADGKAHWIEVRTGLLDASSIEVLSPALSPGTRVIVSGQVGLPEGSPVTIQQ
jgi:multidrug efflux pump subunit AcrA (membrane-fusion protein)